MRRKYLGAVAGLFLAFVFACPLTAAALEAEDVTLSIRCDGNSVAAQPGSYSWKGEKTWKITESIHLLDSDHPDLPAMVRQKGQTQLTLVFSSKPERIQVSRWKSSARGSVKAIPTTIEMQGDALHVPDSGDYIYEVLGSWKQGNIRFGFEVTEAVTLAALEELPKEYTFGMAVENGDVVIGKGKFENLHKLDHFISNVNEKKPASVRVCTWGVDAGPFISDITYDGKKIYCTYDQTRDTYADVINRTFFKSEYDRIEVVPEYSEHYSNILMRTYLVNDATGKRRHLCTYEAPPVTMETEEPVYGRYTTNVQLHITNHTKEELTYDGAFELYKQEGSRWVKIPLNLAIPEWAGILKAGGTVTDTVAVNRGKKPLEDGTYQIAKKISSSNQNYTASAVFEVGQPNHMFGLGEIVKIEAMHGSGKDKTTVQLTRKGKFEGSSPLVYVSDQLALFNGKKTVPEKPAADQILLLVTHKNKSGILATDFLQLRKNGLMQLEGNWYDSGDTEIYSRIQKCVLYAQKFGDK